jgi:protein-S-isoprenylcysteine O-methyltransferase Ste14
MRLFVWLGGGLFVIALAVTFRTYAVVFARDVPYAGWPAIAFDTLLFSCFALHHSLFARDGMKARVARIAGDRLVRSAYVWIASGLLIAVDLIWMPIGGSVYTMGQQAGAVALGVQIAGLWLTVRGAQAIHPLELAGIRDSVKAAALQVGGPYRIVRHPLYLGWLLMTFAAGHMTGDRLVFAAVSTAYLAMAIPFEERSLVRLFGRQYERYRHRVRWRMIPYLY